MRVLNSTFSTHPAAPSISTILKLLEEDDTPAFKPFRKSLASLQEALELKPIDSSDVQRRWTIVEGRFNRLFKLGLWGSEEDHMESFEQLEEEIRLLISDSTSSGVKTEQESLRAHMGESGSNTIPTIGNALFLPYVSPTKPDVKLAPECISVQLVPDQVTTPPASPSSAKNMSVNSVARAGKMLGVGLAAVPLGAAVIVAGAVTVAASAVAGVTLGVGNGAYYVADGISRNMFGCEPDHSSNGSSSKR